MIIFTTSTRIIVLTMITKRLLFRLGDPVEIVVPTGACGNIACKFSHW